MLSINRVIKFLWIFSLLLFLAVIFYGYYLLPDVACIKFDANGNAQEYTERKNIFYIFTGTCALFNIILLALERLIQLLPPNSKPIPNKGFWQENEENRAALAFIISNWFHSFAAIVNCSLLVSFYILVRVNSDFQSNILNYTWMWPVIAVVIIGWIIAFPIRLSLSKLYIK